MGAGIVQNEAAVDRQGRTGDKRCFFRAQKQYRPSGIFGLAYMIKCQPSDDVLQRHGIGPFEVAFHHLRHEHGRSDLVYPDTQLPPSLAAVWVRWVTARLLIP